MNLLMSGRVRSDGALPRVARCVRILLVDHDTTSLMHTASQLQEQHYNVKTAESGTTALRLFQAGKECYDLILADFHMQDMNIYQFLQCIRDQCSNMPIIFLAEEDPMDIVQEAIEKGASFFLRKPLTHFHIIQLWQHIFRVTRRMPGGMTNTDGKRRKTDQNAQGVTFTEGRPKETLTMMNEPRWTYDQGPSHLQRHNDGKRHPFIPFKTTHPVMPALLPTTPANNFAVGQASPAVAAAAANIDYTAARASPLNRYPSWLNPPNYVCYTLDGVQQKLSELNRINAPDQNGGVQISMEGGQVTRTNGLVTGALQVPNQEASGDLGIGIIGNENIGTLGDLNNETTGQGITSPNYGIEGILTDEDIAEIIRNL